MAFHKLSLEIFETLNKSILPIRDTSVYSEFLNIDCPRLQITVPGFTSSVFVEVDPGFSQSITACDLGIQSEKCGIEFADLPDLVYVITWSVAPNDQVYAEYNYLRISKAMCKIRNLYCKLDMGACEPSATLKARLNELTEIEQYLQAAKAKVEYCDDVRKGIALYKYALERITKLEKLLGC